MDDSRSKEEATYPGFRYDFGAVTNRPVATTLDVIPQARACNVPTLRFLLPIVCRKVTEKSFPPELVEIVILYLINSEGGGWTREQAEEHRRRLMDNRKVVTASDEVS